MPQNNDFSFDFKVLVVLRETFGPGNIDFFNFFGDLESIEIGEVLGRVFESALAPRFHYQKLGTNQGIRTMSPSDRRFMLNFWERKLCANTDSNTRPRTSPISIDSKSPKKLKKPIFLGPKVSRNTTSTLKSKLKSLFWVLIDIDWWQIWHCNNDLW